MVRNNPDAALHKLMEREASHAQYPQLRIDQLAQAKHWLPHSKVLLRNKSSLSNLRVLGNPLH